MGIRSARLNRSLIACVVGFLLLLTPLALSLYMMSWRCASSRSLAARIFDGDPTIVWGCVKSELLAVALMISCLGLALLLRQRLLKVLLAIMAGLLLTWAALDFYVVWSFSQRLYWPDFMLLGGERFSLSFVINQIVHRQQLDSLALVAIAVVYGPLLCWVLLRRDADRRHTRRLGYANLVLAATLGLWIWLSAPLDYLHRRLLVSALEYNLTIERPQAYSATHLAAVERSLASRERGQCVAGLDQRRSVVLIIVESLSNYQSQRLSGLNDWLPRFDAMGERGRLYGRFIANGFRSDQGVAATLTGRWPLVPVGVGARPYGPFEGLEDALPNRLRRAGYRTIYLSATSAKIYGVRSFLDSIGFQDVWSPDDPFLAEKSSGFKGVADEDLYDIVAREMSAQTSPTLMVIDTMSSHLPYAVPSTGERGAKAVFNYVDASLADLEARLRESGYFDRGGLLMVLGDHRAMVPIPKAERAKFGNSSIARVPLLVVGNELPEFAGAERGFFQQADISPSLEYLNSATACFHVHQRNLFAEQPTGAGCALALDGNRRAHAHLFCDSGEGEVVLRGDRTAVTGLMLDDPQPLLDEMALGALRWSFRDQ